MEEKGIFVLVSGRLATLKILDWALKYATFDGNLFMNFDGLFFNQVCI